MTCLDSAEPAEWIWGAVTPCILCIQFWVFVNPPSNTGVPPHLVDPSKRNNLAAIVFSLKKMITAARKRQIQTAEAGPVHLDVDTDQVHSFPFVPTISDQHATLLNHKNMLSPTTRCKRKKLHKFVSAIKQGFGIGSHSHGKPTGDPYMFRGFCRREDHCVALPRMPSAETTWKSDRLGVTVALGKLYKLDPTDARSIQLQVQKPSNKNPRSKSKRTMQKKKQWLAHDTHFFLPNSVGHFGLRAGMLMKHLSRHMYYKCHLC